MIAQFIVYVWAPAVLLGVMVDYSVDLAKTGIHKAVCAVCCHKPKPQPPPVVLDESKAE